ncbi:MAG: hypothetical protein JNL11_02300 [Bdellovibrionaceae bacterium]|nr:hypothetical protein [Pseudobdellovibrionaceae bacterium]
MMSWIQKLLVIILVASFVAAPVMAQKGTAGGGGGNVNKSTRADLNEIISTMYRHLDQVSDRYLVGREMKITSQPLSNDLSRITKRILGTEHYTLTPSFIGYVKSLKYEIVDGPCIHEDEERDASTEYKKDAPICLSASRLARFPKSALKQTLIPLIFHEVAHQYGFNEGEANAFQELSELYIDYREIYLSSLRARISCGVISNSLSPKQKDEIALLAHTAWGLVMAPWPRIAAADKAFTFQTCAVRAHSAGENLERVYNGSVWEKLDLPSLSPSEKSLLLEYSHQKDMSFLVIVRTLSDGATVNTCDVCKKQKIDKAMLLTLGTKAALERIDQEVGYRQSLIKVKNEE